MTAIIAPKVNLNGTAALTLLAQNIAVAETLRAAIRLAGEAAPHGRDFQTTPDPEGTFSTARAQHWERLEKLNEVLEEIVAITLDIRGQIDARKNKHSD
jgi:hypothetical protein